MAEGIRTKDIGSGSLPVDVLGHDSDGNTRRFSRPNLQAAIYSGGDGVARLTYAQLATMTTLAVGTKGEVYTDAGTHTDPVVGGTVPNEGVYRWSASPAGWERIGALGFATVQADIDALALELVNENLLIDPAFEFWPEAGPFSATGWTAAVLRLNEGAGADATLARGPSALDGVNAANFGRTVAGTAFSFVDFLAIERLSEFSGLSMTFSMDVRSLEGSGTIAFGAGLIGNYGSGGTPTETLASSTESATTSWTRMARTFAVGDIITGKTYGNDSYLKARLFRNTTHDNGLLSFRRPKLELGARATPWVKPDPGREFVKLARQYDFGTGRPIAGERTVQFRNKMRANPAVTVEVGTPSDATTDEFLWTHSANIANKYWRADARLV